jgi:hypothetical protein
MEANAFCPTCGASLLADARFCGVCGAAIGAPAEAAAPPRTTVRPAAPPAQRRRGLVAAVAIVGLVAVVAAALVLTRGPGGGGAAAGTPAPRPSGWAYYAWSDPAMEIALPAGWTPIERTITVVDPSLSPDQRAAQELGNSWIRDGSVRLAMYGPAVDASGGSDVIWVLVEPGGGSLEAQADQWISEAPFLTPTRRATVDLPSGPAVLVDYAGRVGDWAPVAETDYVLRLADGRRLAFSISRSMSDGSTSAGSAPDAAALGQFARQVVETLRSAP